MTIKTVNTTAAAIRSTLAAGGSVWARNPYGQHVRWVTTVDAGEKFLSDYGDMVVASIRESRRDDGKTTIVMGVETMGAHLRWLELSKG